MSDTISHISQHSLSPSSGQKELSNKAPVMPEITKLKMKGKVAMATNTLSLPLGEISKA